MNNKTRKHPPTPDTVDKLPAEDNAIFLSHLVEAFSQERPDIKAALLNASREMSDLGRLVLVRRLRSAAARSGRGGAV